MLLVIASVSLSGLVLFQDRTSLSDGMTKSDDVVP